MIGSHFGEIGTATFFLSPYITKSPSTAAHHGCRAVYSSEMSCRRTECGADGVGEREMPVSPLLNSITPGSLG